jgi:N-acetylglucosamine kinase-like BadF-type ATPase
VTYYLGIDGGGSKTTCVVGDDGLLLATVTAGPSNITRVGEARARQALHQAIRQASAGAAIDPRQVRRACIGVAGAGREEIADAVRRIVGEVIGGEVEVVGDMHIALEAAFGAGPGVIVIAGTGSIAYGRNAQGTTARAGGWGFDISDEGSGHWIGRTAVSTLLRAIDLGIAEGDAQAVAAETPLFREMAAAWKVQSLNEVVSAANSNPDFAVLFPAVVTAADARDNLAVRVLDQAGVELAQLAGVVARRLFGGEPSTTGTLSLAMIGGVFQHSTRVRGVFRDEVGKFDLRFDVNPNVIDPVVGALQIARQAGKRVTSK